MTAYRLVVTERDRLTIDAVGLRYAWSTVLLRVLLECDRVDDVYDVPEHLAWEIRDAFDDDADGGHDLLPMLDPRSDLYDRLTTFYGSIV